MDESTITMLARLPRAERQAFLDATSLEKQAKLLYDWRGVARPEQVAPEGSWQYWLYLAGRGSGKTRAGSEWVRERVESGQAKNIALVAPTAADARDVMLQGPSGLLTLAPPWNRPDYEPSKRRLTWPNGAMALLFSAEDPDALRGPQFDTAWCDELAAWAKRRETWDMLQFALRLGADPRAFISTTPRPVEVVRELIKDPSCVVTRGTTYSNRLNLAPSFFTQIIRKYEGTRLGRQELDAEVLDDVAGALWTFEMIDRTRKQRPRTEEEWDAILARMVRVVVGVDPSGSTSDEADSQGIVACGLGDDGRGYVLDDASCKEPPAGWARRAINTLRRFGGDRIVAETNYGGNMVMHTIKTEAPSVPVQIVRASRGKHVRAEPISALYEQRRVSHFGSFSLLEDQMRAMTATGYEGEGSPDRLDALVWALTELMLHAPASTRTSTLKGMC